MSGRDLSFGLHLNLGRKKSVPFLVKTFFFDLQLICSSEQNRGRSSSPPMLKIGQKWGKIANYPPQCSTKIGTPGYQRWSRGHKARGQGHKKNPRPRPRTAFPRTDTLEAKDRNARGQGQGPRTQAQVLSKKKRSLQKFFQAISKKKKKGLHKNFSGDLHQKTFSKKIFNGSKNSAVLEPRTGQFSRT